MICRNRLIYLKEVKFTPDVVLKKLTHLKLYKAPGVDKLNSKILRDVAPATASPLSEIFTESMEDLKQVNMVP